VSIRAVCVDRARIVRLEPSVERVEGRTTFEPIPESWFRCRLTINESTRTSMPRSQSALDFRARLMMGGLMTTLVDLDGNPLTFRSDVRLDVSSQQLGRAIWRIEEEPQPIRRRRNLLGYTLTMERVLEREYDDLLLQNDPHPDLNPVQEGC
jgi:hypothetical protein